MGRGKLIVISRNANTGVAEKTDQPEEERRRINAFLESTRRGPLETLILQAEHRKRAGGWQVPEQGVGR
jgi:hypothetical protein